MPCSDSAAAKADLGLCCLQMPEDKFLHRTAHLSKVVYLKRLKYHGYLTIFFSSCCIFSMHSGSKDVPILYQYRYEITENKKINRGYLLFCCEYHKYCHRVN